ncbi:MAG: ERF family protein [Actinomycetota bacterium]|nr:ERF family protein [Actinomycetota bacterium]
MITSPEFTEVAAALVLAQAGCSRLVKDETNPQFKSSYADIDATLKACRKAFNDAGISILQNCSERDEKGELWLETTLLHKSGQWLRFRHPLIVGQARGSMMQALGSAETYARRYSLYSIAALGAADDDGNGSGGGKSWEPPAPPPNGYQREPQQQTRQRANGVKKASATPNGVQPMTVEAFTKSIEAAGLSVDNVNTFTAAVGSTPFSAWSGERLAEKVAMFTQPGLFQNLVKGSAQFDGADDVIEFARLQVVNAYQSSERPPKEATDLLNGRGVDQVEDLPTICKIYDTLSQGLR